LFFLPAIWAERCQANPDVLVVAVVLNQWKNFAQKNTGWVNLNFAKESKDREVVVTWVVQPL
jgi:hypothetical protein